MFELQFLMRDIREYCQKWQQIDTFFELADIHTSLSTDLKTRACFSQTDLWTIENNSDGCKFVKFDSNKRESRLIFSSKDFRRPQIVLQIKEHLYLFGEFDANVGVPNKVI